jgi:hypothetical protein
MAVERVVFIFSLMVASFWLGVEVGYQQSSVELKPCPKEGKAQLISATVTGQVCQYAEIVRGGGKIKWTTRSL